jgi:MerR family transcriptional regulator, redox-sensitive transcriptional activator SoxR
MQALSIGEVARRAGVRASALRYYERAGILPKAGRVNGRRVYDAGTVRRIELLRFAQHAGFTLDEIRTLFSGFDAKTPLSARWRKMAQQKVEELEALSRQVERMKSALELGLQCGCVRIEDCTLSAADAEDPSQAQRRGGCSC